MTPMVTERTQAPAAPAAATADASAAMAAAAAAAAKQQQQVRRVRSADSQPQYRPDVFGRRRRCSIGMFPAQEREFANEPNDPQRNFPGKHNDGIFGSGLGSQAA